MMKVRIEASKDAEEIAALQIRAVWAAQTPLPLMSSTASAAAAGPASLPRRLTVDARFATSR